MSRKEDRLWSEGFERACEIARKDGLQALFDEQRFRGITGFRGRLTSSELEYCDMDVKNLIFGLFRICFVSVLYDEFGFRQKRLTRFLAATDKISEYARHGWIYWVDIVDAIRERVEVDLSIADGKNHLKSYDRPDNEDMYEEPDLIDEKAWTARLRSLGLQDDGTRVTNPSGTLYWEYDNP